MKFERRLKMEENNTITTRYNVLDVREIIYHRSNNYHDHVIVLICKEWNGVNRRRIVVYDENESVFDDAKMLAPGDVIVVHERIYGAVHEIEEIEY